MLAAIDGDYIPYLCAGSTTVEERYYIISEGPSAPPLFECKYKKEAQKYCKDAGLPEEYIHQARHVIDEKQMYRLLDAEFEDIFRNTGATEYRLFFGGESNFRYDIYPEYKSSRKNYSKPVLLPQAKEYLIEKYNAEICEGVEADDAVSIVCSNKSDTVLCSPDKDLDQVPGRHYDPMKGEVYIIDHETALHCLYTQVLTGDSTDSIPGIKGVGPAKARKALAGLSEEAGLWRKCVQMHGSEDSANLTASLVYTLRNWDEHWRAPC